MPYFLPVPSQVSPLHHGLATAANHQHAFSPIARPTRHPHRIYLRCTSPGAYAVRMPTADGPLTLSCRPSPLWGAGFGPPYTVSYGTTRPASNQFRLSTRAQLDKPRRVPHFGTLRATTGGYSPPTYRAPERGYCSHHYHFRCGCLMQQAASM